MIRIGATKHDKSILLKTPIRTSGNIYYLKKTCVSCGLLIANVSASHGQCCRLSRSVIKTGTKGNRHLRSQCQIEHDKHISKKQRLKDKSDSNKRIADDFKAMKPKGVKARRLCLRCGRKFDSKSLHNRICDTCSTKPDYDTSMIDVIGINRKIDTYLHNHGMVDKSGKSLGALFLQD